MLSPITQVNTTMGNKTLHIKYLFFPAHSIQQQGALWIIWDPTINYSRFDSNKFGKLSVRKFLTWKPKLWRALLVFIVWNVLKIMITSMINNLLVLHKSVTPTVSKLKFNLGRGHWSWAGLGWTHQPGGGITVLCPLELETNLHGFWSFTLHNHR